MAMKIKKMIHDAIDTLPEGIHFSLLNGRSILSNKKINRLVYELTGHTFVNAKSMWEELQKCEDQNGCRKLETTRTDNSEQLVFRFADESIWRFTKQVLEGEDESYTQIEASDMTDIYALRESLRKSQEQLTEQMERQKVMLQDIVKNNHEKEVLQFKSRVHDQLGQCILATRQAISEGQIRDNAEDIEKLWIQSIRSLMNIPLENGRTTTDEEDEIKKVAEFIGCEVKVHGERPASRSALKLYHQALREAITNAVRHADANQVLVDIARDGEWYHIVISDNGHVYPKNITEGNGLSNLRKRLEAENVYMTLRCDNGVKMILDLPV